MDWKRILGQLTVNRLSKLAANAGIGGRSRRRKAELVEALTERLDEALKHEALLLFKGSELREIVAMLGLTVGGSRKHEIIGSLLASEQEEMVLELSETDFLLPDRERLDLPRGDQEDQVVEVLPNRPVGAATTLFFELQELLRRPTLSGAVIVSPNCCSSVLERLLGEGLDDLIESAVRTRASAADGRPLITFILDAEHHRLADSEAGGALVSLAQKLSGRIEIRLAPSSRQLLAKVFAFEESRTHGPHLTAIIGSSHLIASELLPDKTKGEVEANVRLSGSLDVCAAPVSVVKEWITHLVRESRSLDERRLNELPSQPWVLGKVAYKLDFDTAHELRLKHLAEHLCRRGRHAMPLFDPTSLQAPPEHQRLAIAGASAPWIEGFLLLDEAGLGKSVEAGMILARELRRRRVYASSDTSEQRQGLLVAPRSQHAHWHEELRTKFALHAEIAAEPGAGRVTRWQRGDAQVVITSPEVVCANWEDIQGFEVLLVDGCHLYDEQTLAALAGIRGAADLCIVSSCSPVQADLSDILSLASLASPTERWDCFTNLPATNDVLGRELRAICSRALRPPLIESGSLSKRQVEDHFYDFDEPQGEAYQELRQMRVDYVERGGHDTAWAFVALEQTFLSSMQAFQAAACRVVGERDQRIVGDLFEQRDGSFDFFHGSSYFRRRLRSVQERIASRSLPNAKIGAKEAALLEILAGSAGQRVVVFTSYRATQERLAGVLARARFGARIERLDARSSLRERLRILERFIVATTDRWSSDGPTGVLLCTDAAAVGLSLQRACAIAVNYDLPWNPQRIEQRIGRLQRWGQKQQVKVFNLAGRNPAAEGWTMDNRVLFACRRLFNMADPTAVANDALREIAPGKLELQLAGDEELSLLADPEPEAIAALDELLRAAPEPSRLRVAEEAAGSDQRYREQITDFWARVSYGGSTLEGARGYLFGRLQLALLQGAVGVLCAPGRKIDDCFTFHLAIGLRLLFESAVLEPREEPLDDQWLVEEEQVHLWAVAPDGALVDWAEFLMGGGLMEVPQDKAAKLVGRDVLDYLVAEKNALETRDLDAVPLTNWRRRAPSSVNEKLAVVQRHAQAMAKARLHELNAQWKQAKAERLQRLEARRAFAVAHAAPEVDIEAIDKLIQTVQSKQLRLRREILGTQLFVVTH